ncbi:hypothetical protein [Tatumella ptyseos]|uniref:hypothetical protein n=1 Tax=Tatumella ptyseos TaxID=82987 RepID=UPI0026EA5A91|nr:hypothetical protein [Tatumella ptyseos]WKX26818.1 hypothetical protein QJR74_01285 [Tatumella ptyseos]
MKKNDTLIAQATRSHHLEWETYLMWAADSFKLNHGATQLEGQALTRLIPLLSPHADLEHLEAFEEYEYPNEIGPSVYDIHGACLSDIDWMTERLDKVS